MSIYKSVISSILILTCLARVSLLRIYLSKKYISKEVYDRGRGRGGERLYLYMKKKIEIVKNARVVDTKEHLSNLNLIAIAKLSSARHSFAIKLI